MAHDRCCGGVGVFVGSRSGLGTRGPNANQLIRVDSVLKARERAKVGLSDIFVFVVTWFLMVSFINTRLNT